jgi:signal transduction histidine kinase
MPKQAKEEQSRQEHEEAAARLRQQAPEILQRWAQHACASVRAARHLDHEALHNNLPEVLEQIAQVLDTNVGRDAYAYAQIPASKDHANQRARIQGYSLDQVILEYHLLRRAVVEVLEQGAPLPRPVGSVIHDGIDRAMQEAAIHFVETQRRVGQEHEVRHQTLVRQAETLREADRAKDEYLAVLAHELRTPLSTISNALHILGQLDLADERAFRQITTASRQTATLSRIVEDLLDISRIARGKLELRAGPIELCKVATNAAQAVGPMIDSRRHVLEVSLPSRPAWVEADPVRLEQVVTNLLTNAARYTEAGGRIWLTVTAEEGAAVIRVRDTGVGIPEEQLRDVFELFTQVGPPSSRSQVGLGIGLALAKRIVELHGGSIAAASDGPGRGSEFTVRLPLAHPANGAD